MGRDEILRILDRHRERLRGLGVGSLAVFGSAARDETRLDSDVDILVEFEGSPSFRRYMDLNFCIAKS